MTTLSLVSKALSSENLELVKTRTLHSNNTSFYQIKDKKGNVFPKSRNNKHDIGENVIIDCIDRFGMQGLKIIFGY